MSLPQIGLVLCGQKKQMLWTQLQDYQFWSYNVKSVPYGKCSLTSTIKKTTNLLETFDKGVVVIFAFEHDFIRRLEDITIPDKKGLFIVRKVRNLQSYIDQIVEATQKWKVLRPELSVVWALPETFSFLEMNSRLANYFDQDSLSSREVLSSTESSKIFAGYVTEMKKLLSSKHPELHICDLGATHQFDDSKKMTQSQANVSLMDFLANHIGVCNEMANSELPPNKRAKIT